MAAQSAQLGAHWRVIDVVPILVKRENVEIVLKIIVLTAAYMLGSIPVGLLLVRVATGNDVRKVGSGRTGGANVLRAAGPWVALLTVLGDGLKGLLAVRLAQAGAWGPVFEALAGLVAVAGHNYPILTGFKGGAGTVAAIGGAIALWPWNSVILIGLGVAAIVATRHTSVGSIAIALLLPVVFALWAGIGNGPWTYVIHGLGTSLLTLWALRPNIQRLRDGRERRVTFRRTSGCAQ